MALYHQLKFPSTFTEYRSVSEWKGVVIISNFDSEKPPLQIYRPRQLPSLPGPKFAPGNKDSFPRVKRPEREVCHSPPSGAEVDNAWRYTITSSPRACTCRMALQGKIIPPSRHSYPFIWREVTSHRIKLLRTRLIHFQSNGN